MKSGLKVGFRTNNSEPAKGFLRI